MLRLNNYQTTKNNKKKNGKKCLSSAGTSAPTLPV